MRESRLCLQELHLSTIIIDPCSCRILLLRRSKERAVYPNLFEPIGGQVMGGESVAEAALRISRDEISCSLPAKIIIATYIIPAKDDLLRGQLVNGIRLLSLLNESDLLNIRLSEQHTEYRWFDLEHLPSLELIPTLEQDIKYASSVARGTKQAGLLIR
jgi:8-oxo-dGTP pyrophosphatase MutT (NUDIX family)